MAGESGRARAIQPVFMIFATFSAESVSSSHSAYHMHHYAFQSMLTLTSELNSKAGVDDDEFSGVSCARTSGDE